MPKDIKRPEKYNWKKGDVQIVNKTNQIVNLIRSNYPDFDEKKQENKEKEKNKNDNSLS